MTIRQWSTTASGNANASSINWAEGQAPSTVNNSARELMAQIRQEYDPERWGWIAFSATASVASQTVFKITGNQTDDYVANRKVKLTGGSATVYADIVSASYTSETTVTIQNASGSLSNSMSIAWLSAVYGNNIPGNTLQNGQNASLSIVTVAGTLTANGNIKIDSAGNAIFTADAVSGSQAQYRFDTAGSPRWIITKNSTAESGSNVGSDLNIIGYSDAGSNLGTYLSIARSTGNVTITNGLSVSGALSLTGGGTVTSATLSIASGMLTVGGVEVASGGITADTAKATTSGTSINFTGIPSTVKRITIIFENVGANTASQSLLVQIGDSGGLETTGYTSLSSSGTSTISSTSGFVVYVESSSNNITGTMTLANITGNEWIASFSGSVGSMGVISGGSKTLSATLDRLSLIWDAGAAFDNGSANIFYE